MNSEQNRRSAPAAAKIASSRLVMAHTARFVHGPGRAGEARQEELSALCTPSADRFIMTHRLLCTIPLEKASPFLRTLPAKFFFHARAFSTIYNLFSVSVSPAGFFQNNFGDFNSFILASERSLPRTLLNLLLFKQLYVKIVGNMGREPEKRPPETAQRRSSGSSGPHRPYRPPENEPRQGCDSPEQPEEEKGNHFNCR